MGLFGKRKESVTVTDAGMSQRGDFLRLRGDESGDYVDVPAGSSEHVADALQNWDALPKDGNVLRS